MTHEKKKLEGAKFIHDRNKWFVRGDEKTLAAKSEMLRNLDKFTVYRPRKSKNITVGQEVGTLIALVIGTPVLITALVIDDFLKWVQSTFSPLMSLIVLVGTGCLLIGVLAVLSAKVAEEVNQDSLTSNNYYKILLFSGQRLVGQVMRTEPTFSGVPATKITYRLESPNGEELKGEYTTSAKVKFQAGDKVVVLYLDDRIHVLL